MKTSAIPRDRKFFAVLVGDSRIGKTYFTEMALDNYSVVDRRRLIRREFVPTPNHHYVATIGAEICPVAAIDMGNGKVGGLMLADVGCSDKFANIRPDIYAGLMANDMIDKFIVTHRGNPQPWIDEIHANCPDAEILELDLRTIKTSTDAKAWIEKNIAQIVLQN